MLLNVKTYNGADVALKSSEIAAIRRTAEGNLIITLATSGRELTLDEDKGIPLLISKDFANVIETAMQSDELRRAEMRGVRKEESKCVKEVLRAARGLCAMQEWSFVDICRGMTELCAAVSALNEEESREDAR